MQKPRDGSLRLAAGAVYGYRDATYAPKRRSTTVFLPAPTLGINSIDPPDMVKLGYAEEIVNWWPDENGLTTRGGSNPWNMVAKDKFTHSILIYDAHTIFAVAGDTIYKLTEIQSTNAQASVSYTGLTEDAIMQHVNFSNAGMAFIHCCNGKDAPIYYNGEAWVKPSFTLNGEEFDASSFCSVTSHVQRLWWVNGTQNVYYGDTNAVQGPLHVLPLGSFMRRGGSIVAIDTITQDGLQGSDDLFVAISSEGEVFLYQGDNPDEIDQFNLVGRGEIPRPIGAPRCTIKHGTDLVVMTIAGLVGLNASLSKVFPGLRTDIMEKISSMWEAQVRLYGKNAGWGICAYRKRGLIIVNLPDENGCIQWVVNPDTCAWVTLSGWENLRCLTEFQGQLLGGSLGHVSLLDNLYKDWSDGEMVPITAKVKHSFYGLGQTGVKKRFTLAKPYLVSSSTPESWMGLVVDFRYAPELSVLSHMLEAEETLGGGATWYKSEWYEGEWGIGDSRRQVRTRWMQALGCGYFCAPIIQVETNTQTVTYAGVELQYEVGNTI